MKNCRDCDEPSVQSSPRRADICLRCWNVRQNVMRAVTAKTMPLEDFQRYQKNGLRTKRLVKMGYGSLVPEQNEAPREARRGQDLGGMMPTDKDRLDWRDA